MILPHTLQAGASLCMPFNASFIAPVPASAFTVCAVRWFLTGWGATVPDEGVILTLDNSGSFAYSSPLEGISSQSSEPVFITSGLSNTCTRSVRPRYSYPSTRKMKSTIEVVVLMFGCSTNPDGSKRVKANLSMNSSSGTPYCKPIEIEMAKQFIMLRIPRIAAKPLSV